MKIKLGEKKVVPPEVVDAKDLVEKSAPTVSASLAREVKKQLSTELAVDDLESILKKEFTPTVIKGLLKDLTTAEDTRVTKDGDYYVTANWDARDKGLTKILKLLKYLDRNDTVMGDQIPTKIVFNVINKQVNIDKQQINQVEPAA